MVSPVDPETQTEAQRIEVLERLLREIVRLAEMHPANIQLQTAKVLAKVGLGE